MDYIEQYVSPVDPEVAEAIRQEEMRQRQQVGTYRLRKLCIPCGNGCTGLCDDQQIRRRISRQALLWWL